MLDSTDPLEDAQAASWHWELDDPLQRDALHRLVALLADEDCAVAERFLRHLVATSRKEPGEAVCVVAGPLALGPLRVLADAIAQVPGFTVRCRVARQGFYRLDGRAEDPDTLCARLVQVAGVAEVRRIQDTIYVLPIPA